MILGIVTAMSKASCFEVWVLMMIIINPTAMINNYFFIAEFNSTLEILSFD